VALSQLRILYIASVLSLLHKFLVGDSIQRYDIVNVKIARWHRPKQSYSYNPFFVYLNVAPTTISFWVYSKFRNFRVSITVIVLQFLFSLTQTTCSSYCNIHSITPRIITRGREVYLCVVSSSLTSSVLQPDIFFVTPTLLRRNTSQLPKLRFCISLLLVFWKTCLMFTMM
jgi:hypothetical protein